MDTAEGSSRQDRNTTLIRIAHFTWRPPLAPRVKDMPQGAVTPTNIDTLALLMLLSREIALRHEFRIEPACASAKPPLAGGEHLHGKEGSHAPVRGPRPGRPQRRRRLLPDFQFQPVARLLAAGTASREHPHHLV